MREILTSIGLRAEDKGDLYDGELGLKPVAVMAKWGGVIRVYHSALNYESLMGNWVEQWNVDLIFFLL